MASRITNHMMVRTYRNNLRSNLGQLSKSNQKLSSQRTFNKASENITDAARALRVRKLLSDNERYITSVESQVKKLDAADSALRTLSGIYDQITGLVTQGLNDQYTPNDRAIIAEEVDMLMEEALSLANTRYNNEYLFNSTGNYDGSAPFSIITDPATGVGQLYYNYNADENMGTGTPIDDLQTLNGKPSADGVTNILYNGVNYVDVGLGLTPNSAGLLNVDTKSVFASSFSGVELFGYGTDDETGIPYNFYGLFSSISTALKSNDTETLSKAYTTLDKSHDHILMSLAEIGSSYNFIEDMDSILTENKLSLQEMQNDIEAVDLSEEIMNNTQYEMAWTVTLQLGSSLLPQSIFDFLR